MKTGEGGEISTSWFEMGLLEASDWKSKSGSSAITSLKEYSLPSRSFQKRVCRKQTCRVNRLYITACGLYGSQSERSASGRLHLGARQYGSIQAHPVPNLRCDGTDKKGKLLWKFSWRMDGIVAVSAALAQPMYLVDKRNSCASWNFIYRWSQGIHLFRSGFPMEQRWSDPFCRI